MSEFGQIARNAFLEKGKKRLLNLDQCYKFSENPVKKNVMSFFCVNSWKKIIYLQNYEQPLIEEHTFFGALVFKFEIYKFTATLML